MLTNLLLTVFIVAQAPVALNDFSASRAEMEKSRVYFIKSFARFLKTFQVLSPIEAGILTKTKSPVPFTNSLNAFESGLKAIDATIIELGGKELDKNQISDIIIEEGVKLQPID